MTRVLLINCVELKRDVDFKFDGLGLAYIASYIREYGSFKDVTICNASLNFNFSLIHKFNPDIIGLSSITQNFNITKNIAKEIKKVIDIPVIVGGYHISALPSNLTCDMDIGVIGEGEQTFLELLFAYEENGLNLYKLSGIDGLIYWLDSHFKFTSKRKLINPLDKIPFPDRELLNNFSGKHYMFTSRGCLYSCMFCSSSTFWGCIRFFSPEYVIEEIKHLINNYHIRNITFYDDLFIADKKRVRKIAELIKKEKINVNFSCSARANLIDNEITYILKDIGITRVSMGLESGCKKTLNSLKGNSVSVKDNFNAVRILKKHHFGVGASFIIGSPNESESDIIKTLDFIKNSDINAGETYILLPFPNTKIWNYCKEKGLVNDFMDWSKFCIYLNDNPERIIISDKISREKLIYFDKLFKFEWKKRYWKYVINYGIFHLQESLYYIRDKIIGVIIDEKN